MREESETGRRWVLVTCATRRPSSAVTVEDATIMRRPAWVTTDSQRRDPEFVLLTRLLLI